MWGLQHLLLFFLLLFFREQLFIRMQRGGAGKESHSRTFMQYFPANGSCS